MGKVNKEIDVIPKLKSVAMISIEGIQKKKVEMNWVKNMFCQLSSLYPPLKS